MAQFRRRSHATVCRDSRRQTFNQTGYDKFKGHGSITNRRASGTSASYIDWGDGTIIENPGAGDLEHTYEGTGEYTIQAVFDWDNSTNINNWGKANKLSWLADVKQFGIKTYEGVDPCLNLVKEPLLALPGGKSLRYRNSIPRISPRCTACSVVHVCSIKT